MSMRSPCSFPNTSIASLLLDELFFPHLRKALDLSFGSQSKVARADVPDEYDLERPLAAKILRAPAVALRVFRNPPTHVGGDSRIK
jgi:hypothetical protein